MSEEATESKDEDNDMKMKGNETSDNGLKGYSAERKEALKVKVKMKMVSTGVCQWRLAQYWPVQHT